MHTVLKKSLLAMLLAGAAAGTAHAADLVHQASNKALLPPVPGEASYLNEADLLSVTVPATAQAQQPAVSPIPEPPVYIMLLIGVGLVSLVARRSSPPPKFSTET
ncbi:PEP-CTERM sorting domain-containing protein [Pseudoduganella aquatica]|uniref:PEP-CTERM sorting domain-containing protein n=1 Tax=Pseudoduganella aquatica TaxID=2660641 RepID=A0A7X4KMW4_9BURK|nr:PEP-CTERM sorting domain-containing protein [Pseudoduganella aquatica]MYN07511.1 PEP-CTERM sorting domain-containing protein [Pseudoduganella aquatica]